MQELHQAIDEELIKMKSESIKASILNVLNSYLKGSLTTAITGYPYEKALKEEIPEFLMTWNPPAPRNGGYKVRK